MPRGGFEKQAIESLFEDVSGMSMLDYANRRRVFHAACHLLTSREEPRRISKMLGFTTTGEFVKQFEAVFDIAPTVYREKFGLEKEETPEEGA